MTTDEAIARITEVDCDGKPQYPDGSVAATLATEVILLTKELAEAKSIASYEVAVEWRDKYKRLQEELADELVMSQAAYREIEKLRQENADLTVMWDARRPITVRAMQPWQLSESDATKLKSVGIEPPDTQTQVEGSDE